MARRLLVFHALVGLVALLLGLGVLDRPLAESIHAGGLESTWVFVVGTRTFDLVTGMTMGKYLLAELLLAIGAVLATRTATRRIGLAALYVGAAQGLTVFVAAVGKDVFDRMRPLEVIARNAWGHEWFVGGDAFPSGHAAFYFGLALPVAVLSPRLRWPLLAVAWFIGCARIVGNHHFLSDVAGSILIATAFAAILMPLHARLARPTLRTT